jgi:hypothetical protein
MLEATSLATLAGIAAGLGISVLVCAPIGQRPPRPSALPPTASSSCHRLPLLASVQAVRRPGGRRRGGSPPPGSVVC